VSYQPEVWSNHPGTTLNGAISSATRPVTFTVASAAGLAATGGFRVIIDNELLLITTISGTSLTGSSVEGTTAATHSNGANVTAILTAGSLAQQEVDVVNDRVGVQVNTVSFSTTPTFDASLGKIQAITLTANVTSSTISNIIAGQTLLFVITQDATGGRTFVWPAGVTGMTIGSTASKRNIQAFLALSTSASDLVPLTDGTINK
jgi:hypothetical protein